MRLSDMQCSRNLIDKALEVNQTALKFCKDKDDAMKDELEKQKTRLIERKLMQSIERIEKGWTSHLYNVVCFTPILHRMHLSFRFEERRRCRKWYKFKQP